MQRRKPEERKGKNLAKEGREGVKGDIIHLGGLGVGRVKWGGG